MNDKWSGTIATVYNIIFSELLIYSPVCFCKLLIIAKTRNIINHTLE